MGLFNQILGALNNPQQEANPEQLAGILDSVEQASRSYNAEPAAVQSAMSIVGKYAKNALREKRSARGDQEAQQIVNQYAGTQPSPQGVQALFSMPQIQQLTQEIENRTGINQGMVQAMLPILVPLVLNFLKTGHSRGIGANNVLSGFLDNDRDGDIDIADALQMASRHLGR
ncbi:MAG: hypothetical protein ACFB4I_17100 [Cyanophyceae cyanobacterium]